jgi:hypothetical protein
MCLCSRGVLSVQILYFAHNTIIYDLNICFFVNFFVMRDILIATRSRCVMSVSDKAPETWPFLWNLSRRDSLRVVSGGGVRERERVCTLYSWGRGHAAPAPEKKTVFGWRDFVVVLLEGLVSSKGNHCLYCPVLSV